MSFDGKQESSETQGGGRMGGRRCNTGSQDQMGGVCAKMDITVGAFGHRLTNFTSQNGGYCETSRLGHRAENHVGVQLIHKTPGSLYLQLY